MNLHPKHRLILEYKISAVGAMTREQLDAEIRKGVDSIKAGKVYSADEVDAAFAKEFGI